MTLLFISLKKDAEGADIEEFAKWSAGMWAVALAQANN